MTDDDTEGLPPPDSARMAATIRRETVVRRGALGLSVLGCLFAARYWQIGLPAIALVLLLTVLALLMVVRMLRETHGIVLAGSLVTILFFVVLLAVVTVAGGFATPTFGWFYLLPLVAGLGVGKRGAWLAALAVGVTTVAFWLEPLASLGSQVPEAEQASHFLLSRLAAVLAVAILTHALLKAQVAAEESLLEANRSLQQEMIRRMGVEDELRKSQERYRAVSELTSDYAYSFRFDESGVARRQWITDAFERITGFEPTQLSEESWTDLVHPEDREMFRQRLAKIQAGDSDEREYRVLTRSGEVRWIREKGRPVLDETGTRVVAMYGAGRDVTDEREIREKLEHAALHDPLTLLPNRALLKDRLHQARLRSVRDPTTFYAVIFLDLDGFKLVNDSLGHAVGDQLLCHVAEQLKLNLREVDTVARISGDEFVVLLSDLRDRRVALKVAERCSRLLDRPMELGEHGPIRARPSIGIAFGGPESKDPDEILRNADMAMYRAKEESDRPFVVFDNEFHEIAVAQMELERDLRAAVERREFFLEFQPIAELATGRLVGLEALARWRHPARGIVSPGEFLTKIEESELLVPFTRLVLELACTELVELRREHPAARGLWVAVNMMPRHFSRPDLPQLIDEILFASGLEPTGLCLELTEEVMIDHPERATEIFQMLARRGVRVALDDFGRGYSSLSYLHRFSLDKLKVDRAFVSRLDDRQNLDVVACIVQLGQRLGLTVVAEGIETAEQLSTLQEIGCHLGQGFFLARPMASRELRRYLVDRTGEGDEGRETARRPSEVRRAES